MLDVSCESFVGLLARSGVPFGDRAAFSCANHDNGLLPSPPLDFGLCCHESVPDRANCVAVGGVDAVGDDASASPSAIFAVDNAGDGLSSVRGEASVFSRDDLENLFSGDTLRDARSNAMEVFASVCNPH